MKTSTAILLGLLASVLVGGSAQSQWRQFGGPGRNFHCPAVDLADSWPEKGPPVEWRREIGDGYACVLVENDRLYTMARRDGKEVVLSLERESGRPVWEFSYPVEITNSARQFGGGPASTPALAGDRLITIGVGMDLYCFEKNSGKVLWHNDLMEQHELPMPGRGYSSSPLVHKSTVILPLGGLDPVQAEDDEPPRGVKDGAVTAFDLDTGDVVWARHNFPESKASPLLIQFAGRPHLVVFMGNELAGLNPDDGALLWSHEHPTSYGFNCATPVFDGVDTLVCSSAYNNWTEAVQLVESEGKIKAQLRWASRRLKVHFTNLVLVDGLVYGSNGMGQSAFLVCIDAKTGAVNWRRRGFGRANLLYGDERFLILDENGLLALATCTEETFEIHGRLRVSESYAYAAPTLVGSKLYLRDRTHLTAFDLSTEAVALHEKRTDDKGRFSLDDVRSNDVR